MSHRRGQLESRTVLSPDVHVHYLVAIRHPAQSQQHLVVEVAERLNRVSRQNTEIESSVVRLAIGRREGGIDPKLVEGVGETANATSSPYQVPLRRRRPIAYRARRDRRRVGTKGSSH